MILLRITLQLEQFVRLFVVSLHFSRFSSAPALVLLLLFFLSTSPSSTLDAHLNISHAYLWLDVHTKRPKHLRAGEAWVAHALVSPQAAKAAMVRRVGG